MYMTDNLPFVMTCDAVETPTEDENVHIKVPFKVANHDVEEPAGDDAGEGEPSQAIMDAAPTPPAMKHSGKIVHIVRKIKVVPEKVKDEIQDSLAKDEAIAMDKRTVATSAADCKAKNKFRCPYHGAAAMSDAFRDILDKRGLGDMKFTIKPFDEGDEDDTSYILDFECPEEKVDTVGMDALKDFGKLKGIVIDTEDTEGLVEKTEEGRREALFEVDFFDKAAEDPVSDAGEGKGHEDEKAEPKTEEGEKETVKEEPSEDKGDEKDGKDDSEEDKDVEEEKKEEDEPSGDTSKKEVEYEDVEDDSAEAEEESTDEDEIVPAEKHDIPTDPVERAMKAAKDFESLISESKRKSMAEYKSQCDECAKDIDFLQKAVDTAPNDRMKKKMTDKFDAANKRMMMLQSELKHSCGDAMRELKSNIGKSVADASACEVKMEHDSGRDIKKEINSLKEELEMKSITKVDGYKEMRKAEKEFEAAKSKYDKLMDSYNDASDNDDYLSMIHYGEAVKKHIGTCNEASDKLKSARENVKASLVKKADEARKARYASTPERLRQRGAIPGESIEQYTERFKKLGMKLPVSFDCREYVKSDEFADYCKRMGVSSAELESAKRTTNTYAKALKKANEHYRDEVFHMSESDYNNMCSEFADVVNENMERCSYGCRIWADDTYNGGYPLDAVICGHLMNQMEVGASHGSPFSKKGRDNAVATNTRAKYSHTCYGGAYHMPPDKYEKYGCIASANPRDDFDMSKDPSEEARNYGDCIIRFKKDKVTPTISSGDSSWGWGRAISSLPMITDCKPTLATGYKAKTVVNNVKRGMKPVAFQNALGCHSYCELHYHEENMGAEFIESISLPTDEQFRTLSPKAIELILKHNIKVYIDGKLHTVTA